MSSALAAKLRNQMFGDKPTSMSTYHDLISKSVEPGMTVLDVGCGRGAIAPYSWRQHTNIKLWGIDPDPTAAENPHLEAFALRSYPWILVHRLQPTEWRRIIGIKQGGKEAPMAYARMILPDLDDQDQADAICIARALTIVVDPGA